MKTTMILFTMVGALALSACGTGFTDQPVAFSSAEGLSRTASSALDTAAAEVEAVEFGLPGGLGDVSKLTDDQVIELLKGHLRKSVDAVGAAIDKLEASGREAPAGMERAATELEARSRK